MFPVSSEHKQQAIPLHTPRDARSLAQQPSAAAVYQAFESVQTLPEGREEGVVAQHTQGRQGAVAGAAAGFCPAFAPR